MVRVKEIKTVGVRSGSQRIKDRPYFLGIGTHKLIPLVER